MLEKYICMKEGCSFATEDEPDAIEHYELGNSHDVVLILLEDSQARCQLLGVRPEKFEELESELGNY